MIPIQCYFPDKLGQRIKDLAKEQSRTLSNTLIVISKEYFKQNSNKE